MKAISMFAAAMVLMTAPAMQAQDKNDNKFFSEPAMYASANIPAILKAFENCLATDNEGVQESAMAQLAMLKLRMPAVETAKIVRHLEDLSMTAPAPDIRFKAYITSQVYKNPELFVKERSGKYNDGEELFNALAARLQSSLLSYRGQ
jgi:hypothetical protein